QLPRTERLRRGGISSPAQVVRFERAADVHDGRYASEPAGQIGGQRGEPVVLHDDEIDLLVLRENSDEDVPGEPCVARATPKDADGHGGGLADLNAALHGAR